jgi:chaperonin GroEL (HSP60 family)
MTLAKELRDRASSINGRKQLAYRAFADALESIVTELVRNCGQDPASVITRFRASNAEDSWTGFHFPSNDFVDTRDLGLFDPYALKRRCLVFGFEVARVVLRIDDAVDASFSETPAGPGDSINEKAAERHMDYIEENDTRWSEP